MLCAVDGSASIAFDKLHQCRGYNSEGEYHIQVNSKLTF